MASTRYASRTDVEASRSQDQIKVLLRKAGADQLAVYESVEKSAVAFRIASHFYRMTVPARADAKNPQQEERTCWRLLHLLVKAKLEAIGVGATTFEREFLADMMLADGTTVHEAAMREIDEAQRLGRMPTTLLLQGPRP